MERLTKREPRGSGLHGVGCTHFGGADCKCRDTGHCCNDGCSWEYAVWDRLAAYEDTGLEPCDYAVMRAAMEQAEEAKQQLSDVVSILGCSDINNLKELAQAEKDGRLVAPPCQIGAPVWWITLSWVEKTVTVRYTIESGKFRYAMLDWQNPVYTSQAAAEAALAEMAKEGTTSEKSHSD